MTEIKMINFLFLSGTKAIYVCDFVRKTLFLENPTNLLLSYRFRFIGCEALCIRVRDSRNTDSQSTNEDVCILTSLNFISLSLSLSPFVFLWFIFFSFSVIRCSARFPIFSRTYARHSCDFSHRNVRERERENTI